MPAVAELPLEEDAFELTPAGAESGVRLRDGDAGRAVLDELGRQLRRVPPVEADLAQLPALGEGRLLRADIRIVGDVAGGGDEVAVADPIRVGHPVVAAAC